MEGTGGGGESSSEIGIPTGLNRIKTRKVSSRERLSSKHDDDGDDVEKSIESLSFGASRPPAKPKLKKEAHGGGMIGGAKEGSINFLKKKLFGFFYYSIFFFVFFFICFSTQSCVWFMRKFGEIIVNLNRKWNFIFHVTFLCVIKIFFMDN